MERISCYWWTVTFSLSEQRTSPVSWTARRTCFRGRGFLKDSGSCTSSRFGWFGPATGQRRWICSPRARMHIGIACCSSPCLTPRWRGRADIALASNQAVCFSSNQYIATGVMHDQGRRVLRWYSLAEPALDPRPDRAAGGAALADSHQEGSAISGLVWQPNPELWSLSVWGYQRSWAPYNILCSTHSRRHGDPLRVVCMLWNGECLWNSAICSYWPGYFVRDGCSAFSTIQTG